MDRHRGVIQKEGLVLGLLFDPTRRLFGEQGHDLLVHPLRGIEPEEGPAFKVLSGVGRVQLV